MEIIKVYANTNIPSYTPCVACIGYFDGLHLGHQALINKVIALAKQKNKVPTCICFDVDPWEVVKKNTNLTHITPNSERFSQLAQMGIERCYVLHFDEAMMRLSVFAFINEILCQLHLDTLVCGSDFHFAHKGEGDCLALQNQSFALEIVPPLMDGDKKISSSTIEEYLLAGKIEKANALLGRAYQVKGIVVKGKQVGRSKLGFPTANLQLTNEYVIPKKGVYVGLAHLRNHTYKAMINIGHNPTMNYTESLSIEGYLLDFDDNIYGEEIAYSFLTQIRDEQRFPSMEALIEQLHNDVAYAKAYKGE